MTLNDDNPQEEDIPPPMGALNGCVRFLLEMVSLVAMGHYGWFIGNTTITRILLVIAIPAAAASMWGIFAVLNDPSRSGHAVLPVSGAARLAVEFGFFAFAGYCISQVWHPTVAGLFAGITILHYLAYWKRIVWILKQ